MVIARRILLSFVLLIVTVVSFFLSSKLILHDKIIYIRVKGNAVYIGALAEDRKITIKATYGVVRIQIKGNRVAVVDAECPDKNCVRTGWRSHEGDSILCEPNQLVILILENDGGLEQAY